MKVEIYEMFGYKKKKENGAAEQKRRVLEAKKKKNRKSNCDNFFRNHRCTLCFLLLFNPVLRKVQVCCICSFKV